MAKLKQAKAFIESARKASTFESAHFHRDTETVTLTGAEITEFIKERTRIYRTSWILPYLDHAVEIVDGLRGFI